MWIIECGLSCTIGVSGLDFGGGSVSSTVECELSSISCKSDITEFRRVLFFSRGPPFTHSLSRAGQAALDRKFISVSMIIFRIPFSTQQSAPRDICV